MQAGPSLTWDVRAAMAASSVTASSRGWAKSESPAHTLSNRPLSSARQAIVSRSAGVFSPSATPRLESVRPNFTAASYGSPDCMALATPL
jgi:hypothetical protein